MTDRDIDIDRRVAREVFDVPSDDPAPCSSDGDAAMAVIQRMAADGWSTTVDHDTDKTTVRFERDGVSAKAVTRTFPLSVCKAALKALANARTFTKPGGG